MVAMRTITVERGYDPREFTLVPFGGMGPTIAGLIAAELGIGRILIPRDPGTFSAYGMLVTDVHQTRSLTRITPLDGTTRRRPRRDLCRDGGGRACRTCCRSRFPRERLQTRATRRHALPRPVLRGERAGARACSGRDDLADLVAALPRCAPAPLRPHGAGRGGGDRQFPGHGDRPHPEAGDQAVRSGTRPRAARRRSRSGGPISMRPTPATCRSCAAATSLRARASKGRR